MDLSLAGLLFVAVSENEDGKDFKTRTLAQNSSYRGTLRGELKIRIQFLKGVEG